MTYIEERLLKSGLVEERSLSEGTSTSPDLSVPWCTALVMLLKILLDNVTGAIQTYQDVSSHFLLLLGLDKCKLHHVQDLEGGPQSRDLYLELFMVQKDILALTKKGEASKKGDGGRS
ncbi:hypothetical protein WN943_026889 [Citrus x changshan-huyou]